MEYIKIPLSGKLGKGLFTLVDGDYDGEYFSQYTWYVMPSGYVIRTEYDSDSKKTITIYLHKEVAGSMHNLWIDHINRNKLDNRSCNLRFTTPVQNCLNRSTSDRPKNGYKGVYRPRNSKKNWQSKRYVAQANGTYLGTYNTEIKAAKAYDKAAANIWGENAVLNFPVALTEAL